ncbi:MAG: ATP synthase F1 subunit delta [Phycisphaerae bacterium]|nr:ATP synthase F1 subunit delta [Phycisphaerae bacterium]
MATPLDERMAIAGIYAEALFGLARDADIVEEIRSELRSFVELTEANAELLEFLTSGAIDSERRAASIEKMFRGKLSDIVLNTLLVMNGHRRLNVLPSLLRCFVLLHEEAAGQIEAVVTSAVELGEAEREAIVQLAADKSGKNPLVRFVVDESILGGLILQIADLRYDNSLRRHLGSMREKLLHRGERGIDIGAQA